MEENTKGAAAPQVVADERAAFEADTLETHAVATFGRFPASGRYNVDWIENQWGGWQRRAALAAAPVQAQESVEHVWSVNGMVKTGGDPVFDGHEKFYTTPVQPVAVPDVWRDAFIKGIVLSVAEIPDRDSPEEQPEMMLVTSEELRGIIESQFEISGEAAAPAAPAAPAAQGDAKELTDAQVLAVAETHFYQAVAETMDDRVLGFYRAAIAAKAANK